MKDAGMSLHADEYHLISFRILLEHRLHILINHREGTNLGKNYNFSWICWFWGRRLVSYGIIFPKTFGLCSVAITGISKTFAILNANTIASFTASDE
jgi:hypothetical protein